MSLHVALKHITHYSYDRPVTLGPQIVRLRPAPHSRTPVLSYSLRIEPAEHFINWQQDPFANYQARLVFPQPTKSFKVTVDMVVDMVVLNPFDFFLEPGAARYPFEYEPAMARALAPYLAAEPATPLLQRYLDGIDRSPQPTNDFLVALNQRLRADINYSVRMEPGVQTPEQTLALAWGSCRDTGWLLVQLLRHLGLAARFVSGYLIQLKADVKSLDGPSGSEKDATDLHAWCEVFLPGAGWVGLDPSSGLMAGEGHIPLACTPEPSSAAPIEGGVGVSEVRFSHHMELQRIYQSPRVSKPYTEDQWAAVLALGEAVDRDLADGDVRLAMGSKPTFVATSDRDAAEWNSAALGPTKRGYADELVQKLKAEYGQGGLLHCGQSDWYPGEPLPRWALGIFWRADGQPVWKNPALFADERQPGNYTADDAARFMTTLAGQLGLPAQFIVPGFEDVRQDLADAMERERLRQRFTQGQDWPVGYALPLRAKDMIAGAAELLAGPAWDSGPWFFRDLRMVLIPGDSPMGYRLPLDSSPWLSKTDQPGTALESAASLVRTVLCVEVRDPQRAKGGAAPESQPQADAGAQAENRASPGATTLKGIKGALYVFMPPTERLDDYLGLLAAVEASAETLKLKIILEGYQPPRDPRLKMLSVTPELGVIAVDSHPTRNWGELVAHTECLYRIAHETRLSAEKFMTDGRHTGTGGGNDVVLGAASAADSPFLRRPDLLASLLAYWHNHPSLSYLFSGLFIGPDSPAPRIDEGRNDQLYELEIALREIATFREKKYATEHDAQSMRDAAASPSGILLPPAGDSQDLAQREGDFMPPWMVDRTLGNLLVDVTGNRKRSEFGIDKLYPADSSTGRLGLLKLRAFEMPPHARMSIALQLLLRALVARFWKQPYRGRLVRWGTALHDRFLLPSFVRMDFDDVLTELNEAGYPFDRAWFEPHFEFRFSLIGQVKVQGIELILRSALEPWRVRAEEGDSGGTTRYVDSSLERIEVHVTGLNDSRYVVTVNGRALPLQSTGTAGECVAGVRYKAWNPPSSLHPSISVHAPLTFDIVDRWMQRSLGGCQYHVTHPGGINYATLPVNAYEAESRRLARFFQMGHTPGKMDVVPAAPSREFPFTLDLR